MLMQLLTKSRLSGQLITRYGNCAIRLIDFTFASNEPRSFERSFIDYITFVSVHSAIVRFHEGGKSASFSPRSTALLSSSEGVSSLAEVVRLQLIAKE